MNWNRVEADWKRYQSKVVERWDKLSQDDLEAEHPEAGDLDRTQGRRDQLESKLQQAYGLSRDQAKKDVDDFC